MRQQLNPPTDSPGSYQFTDHSVLRPWATRVWFELLFRLMPRWLAANLVTLLSTGTLAAILVGSAYADRLGPTWFALLQLVALQLYVAGDHLDGMQAKATGTKSPLGDFLDHHCDLWAGGVVCFGFWSLTGTTPLWMLYAATVTLISAFAITYVERAERRALHFTAWGTLEVIAILSAFYVSWAIPGARAWWLEKLVTGYARHVLVAALAIGIAWGAMIVIARRLKSLPAPLLLHVATLVALAAGCLRVPDMTPIWGWLIVALTGADYVAQVMHAVSTTRPRPWPDVVPVLATVIVWIFPADSFAAAVVLWLLTVWLVGRYAITLARILAGWRQHWVWKN